MSRFTPFFTPTNLRRPKRVYISGPMTGYKNNNFPAFDEAANTLRESGYAVCSPADTSAFLGKLDHAKYLRFDFERILEADFLVALDGWKHSMGALAELLMAARMGVQCWDWEDFNQYHFISASDVEHAIGRRAKR